jgi:hypothetical protein
MDARVAGREGAAKGVALLLAGGGGLHVNAEEVEGGSGKVKHNLESTAWEKNSVK